MAAMRVKIEGIKELQAKLKDPRLIGEPLKEFLEYAANTGKAAAVEPLFDKGRHLAWQSILTVVDPAKARVFSAMPIARARSIEAGRKPGTPEKELAWLDWDKARAERRQPRWTGPLARWAKTDGHSLEAGQGPVPDIIKAISAGGVKGKRFMRAAKEAIKEALPVLLERMARRVEERFGRK